MLKKGDTIQCADADDAINTMTDLAKNGVETDFLYKKMVFQVYGLKY